MPPKVIVGIQTTYADAGAAAAKVALGQVGNAASKADKDLLAYAQTAARLASAQGNAAGAADILASALSQVDRSSRTALAAEQQLVTANNALARSAQSASGGMAVLPRTIAGLSHEAQAAVSRFATLSGAIAGAGAIIAVAKGAFDLAQVGANADLVRQRFDGLAVAAGTTGNALMNALRSASGGEISDLNLQLAANRAQLLGVASGADELGVLMGIARDKAQQLGLSSEQAFNDLIVGLGRGSVEILDNLAITVSAKSAYDAYATSIGKTANELDAAEKKQAIINATIAQGKADLESTGGAIEGNASAFARASTQAENAKNAFGSFLSAGLAPLADQFAQTGEATQALLAWIGQIGTTSDAAAAGTAAYAAEMERSGSVALANAAYEAAHAAALQVATAATQQATAATQQGTAVMMVAADAEDRRAAATMAATVATMADAAAKEADAAQTALLTAQTEAAVSAFMLLHPGITASGVAAMSAAGQIDPLIAQLIQARLRAIEAANALAQFNILQGVKALPRAAVGAERREVDEFKAEARAADQAAKAKVSAAQYAATKERTLAIGTTQQKIALYNNEYKAAVAMHGAGSVQAYQAQTRLLQAQEKGGAARAGAAGAAGSKLESIEAKTGEKMTSIMEAAQGKITAIIAREAAKQAQALQKLNESIATTAADRRVSDEADDLDLIGSKDKKDADRLNDRERAQADARKREEAAAAEARATAEAGDAELAQKQYDIRAKQNDAQEALDEKYYEKQRELAGDPENQAALQQQYDEATRANDEAAQTRIAIAQAESAQKKAEVEAEKADIIASAEDSANKVVGAAQRSAAGVKAASADAKAQAVADLGAIGAAVAAIPAQKTITITVNQSGDVSAGSASGTKAAGGGTFVTNGPHHFTVGDNPGGRELVTVTPLSGVGRTSVGAGASRLAGGGNVVVDAGGGYTTPIASGGTTGGKSGGKGAGKASTQSIKDAVAEQKAIVELLKMLLELRDQLSAQVNAQPFNMGLIRGLAQRAAEFVQIVKAQLIPITKEQSEGFKRYIDTAKGAIDILSSMADLRSQLQENANDQPFDMGLIKGLARRAAEFVQMVQAQLIPVSEYAAEGLSHYADAVSTSVGILGDIADLRKDLSEGSGSAFDMALIADLAADAKRVTAIVRTQLLPMSEQQAKDFGLYADVASNSIGLIKDVSDLGKTLRENAGAPIDDALIADLAAQAKRTAQIVQAQLVPTSEDEAKALQAWADAVGASVGIIKDVSALTGDLFTDYVSPSDAQIAMIAADAKRVVNGVMRAASTYSKDGLDAGKAYAEGVGATFGAYKDGLLFFDALKSGDFKLDQGALRAFEQSTLQTMDVAKRLGAVATTIPAGDIAALGATTAALAAQSEALIKLAAVPFGDIQPAAAALQQQGAALLGGGQGAAGLTVNIYNPPPTMNVPAVVAQVKQALRSDINMRQH